MISMIFRFFLQSGEYEFFVKRLKNVVASKVNSDENIVSSIIQAEDDDHARLPRQSYSMNPKRGYQKNESIDKSQLYNEQDYSRQLNQFDQYDNFNRSGKFYPDKNMNN